jgi:hypothetical protein
MVAVLQQRTLTMMATQTCILPQVQQQIDYIPVVAI